MASSFNVNFEDLQRILESIKIAERESAGEQLIDIITEIATGSPAIAGSPLVNAANLPLGLRHVDGSNNHLIAGAPGGVLNGAADQPFASLLQRQYITNTASPAYDLNPGPGVTNVANNSYDPTNPQANDAGVNTNRVVDASIRTISNLIVDQTVTNPAAIAAALRQAGDPTPNETAIRLYNSARDLLDPTIAETDKDGLRTQLSTTLASYGVSVSSDGSISVEHKSADIGLSPANSSWMTIFGQFFDHGLDLVGKGGQGTVYMPLKADDPLYVPGSPTNFMALSRAGSTPGINGTTPWIDQNQTYTSHPSHQVFLREYTFDANGRTVATGRLLDGASGGMPTWKEVKANALTYLGIQLDDRDVGKIPELLTDAYGKFIPGANGFAQLVIGVSGAGTPTTVEGTAAGTNATTVNARRINAAFLEDINAAAAPVLANGELQPDGNAVIGIGGPGATDPAVSNGLGGFTTYDNELLDAHFCGGDGRSNENIALTATHSIFHNEHNRVMEANKLTILRSGNLATINEWLRVDLASNAQLPPATASDAELQTFANGLAWEGERMFQAAKFSTEMQYQHLVFEEFARRIQPNIAPFVFTNSADLDGRIVAEFAHAVYRFGHSQLGDGIARLDNTLAANDTGLIQAFLNPEAFSSSGPDAATATGAILRGITRVVDQEIDEFVVEALRNNLLGAPLDLASLNLARGREQGIPSLNESRRQLFAMTGAVQLKPYTGWTVDPTNANSHGLFQHLKNQLSVVNLIAAYGTHPTITTAASIEAKRDAAMAIVFGIAVNGSQPPSDALEFMRGTGSWALQETGLNLVDLWVGGLAEQINEFGGQLGDTFNAIFQYQLEHLQNGDRFYYLSRTQGMNLLTQLEASTFADLVMRNTDLGTANSTHLAGHIMGVPDYILELDRQVAQANYSGDASRDGSVGATNTAEQRALLDPTAAASMFDFLLGGIANSKVMRQYGTGDLNGDGFVDGNVIRFTGGEHVVLGGTEGNDAIYGDKGIDTLWGDGGDDYINPGMESDEVFGGDGDDIIVDPFGADFLRGGRGDDVIVNGAGLDIDFGEQGQDVMIAIADTTEQFGGEGNDFLMGSTAGDTQLGGEGDDWMEGGEGFDGMAGDNSELFFNSPIVGHDIMNGQGNDTDYDGENGDDIMVQGVGIQRNNGMSGFDWVIHKDDPVGANTDLTTFIPGLVATPGAAVAVTLRDRFDSVEGASGWKFNDNLKGSVRAIAGTPWFQNQLTQAGVDRITGLQQVIGGTGQVDPNAVAFGALNVNGNSEGQIFLGGDGSDTIMGGIGDDVIDGDAWLNVRLVGEYKSGYGKTGSFTANSLSEIANDLVAGGIDPGTMRAVREILYDGATNGTNPDDVNIDIALFQDIRANYTITNNADGSVTVAHTTVPAGLQSDGIDRLRNMEIARFADQDINLINYKPTAAEPFTTRELSTNGFFGIGAANNAFFSAPALFDRNNVTATNPTGTVAANTISLSFVDGANQPLATTGGVLRLGQTPGQQLQMTASYIDASGLSNSFTSPLVNAIVGTTANNTLNGTNSTTIADYIFGGNGTDTLNGNDGDDHLSGGAGNDALSGGNGIDTANFAGLATSVLNVGNPQDQNITTAIFGINGNNISVTTTTGGTDSLNSIEKLRFSDGTFDLVAGTTNAANILSYGGTNRAVLFGAGGNDILAGGGNDDVLSYTAAGSNTANNTSGGGRDVMDGGANAALGDRAVINGDNSTETFRVFAIAGAVNAAQRTALTAFGTFNANTEIVVLRGSGNLQANAALTTANFAVIAELDNIEELTINVNGSGAGTQRVQVFGDFAATSLRTNTITVTSDGAGVEVDVTGIESEHRVVLDAGTIIGQRSQDSIGNATSPSPHDTPTLPGQDDNDSSGDDDSAGNSEPTGVDASKAIHLGLSLQKVPEFDGDLPADIVLRRFGTTQEQKSQFYLALTAESLRDASIDTLDVTLDLGADFFDVFQISGQQIFFSEDMAVQRQVRIDGTKVRFEGAGLSALGEGLGKGVDSTAPIAVIALTLRDDINDQIQGTRGTDRYGFLNRETWQQSLNFEVSANIDQVVFSDLVSLRDLGGDDALMSDELHVMARAAQAELSTDSTFGIGTERSVLKPGETGFTNLIRSGDTIERITQWQNDGEFSFRDFTITNIDQAGVAKAVSVFLADDATTLNTLAPDSGDGAGEVAEIRTTFMVSGQAGSVLDTSKLGFQLDAFGGYHWDTSKMDLFQQKNLITFQGDLNYDGAVTMKDLAFLNAGAARGSDDARGYSRDVDANFDGELDIDDLAILDADWGRSLHQGQSQFLGSDQLSMASLTGQGQHHWDSSAFQAQNTIEAKETYVNPITDATGTLVDVQGFQALEALLQEQQQQYGLN